MLRRRAPLFIVAVVTASALQACASDGAGVTPSKGPAFAATKTALAGTWTLTGYRVSGRAQDIAVPGGRAATLKFSRNGHIGGNDLTNTTGGQFDIDGRTLTVHDTAGTLVGVTGGTSGTLAEAINTIFVSAAAGRPAALTIARFDRIHLTLSSGATELQFTRA